MLINIHTQARVAVAEIGALDEVVTWTSRRFAGERNFIPLGDFNELLDGLELRGRDYFWIVPDDSDRNPAHTARAYDRIVGTAHLREHFAGRWGVARAFDDNAVGDHWPVWVELATSPQR